MPTISQLPTVAQVTAADRLPISQSGVTRSVSIGTLLSVTQPAVLTDTGTLLGRTSLGNGGPEPVTVGAGLALTGETLSATGTDHAAFAQQTELVSTDQAVLNSGGQPKLLELAALRGLFAAGVNVAIDSDGTISASAAGQSIDIAKLPTTNTASPPDLIAISQAGADRAISYAALINGLTIDAAQTAAAAQDSDTLWMAQGSSTMVRQNLSALWTWMVSKLPGVHAPVLELGSDTALDTTVHNGRLVVCSQPLTLQAIPANMGSGFSCTVVNMSSGAVTLGGTVVTSSGEASLLPGQSATIHCFTYSGGTAVYAAFSNLGGTSSPPATVAALSVGSITQNGIALAWSPATGASSYMVQYRVQGSTDWVLAGSGIAEVGWTVTGLLPSTTYEFAVTAVNGAGSSPAPATTTATTAAPLAMPGQVSGLTAGGITASAVTLTWSAPTMGGPVASYTAEFRISGSGNWTTASAGISGAQYTVGSLLSNTSYDFRISAVNAAGTGPASPLATATTSPLAGTVNSITWNIVPSGSYVHGVGSIAVNAHINPGTASVRFGFSSSAATLPNSWVAANYVNTDLWGAYVTTPSVAGTWYVWASGSDGSCPTVYPTSFTVS